MPTAMSTLPVPLQADAPLPLDERTRRIVVALERAALEVGQELLDAKREHPGEFMAWVDSCLPFGIDKAERLMAITKAFGSCEPEVRAALPPAWSALYELQRLPSERLMHAIEAGEVTADMSVVDARRVVGDYHPDYRQPVREPPPLPPEPRLTTDIVAREMMRLPRTDLSPSIETMIRCWLDPTHPEETDGPGRSG